MSSNNQNSIEDIYFQQLSEAFDLVCAAKKEERYDLCELSVHYIFDLLDWGRRNMEIKDTKQVSIHLSTNKNATYPTNIIELEEFAEQMLMASYQMKQKSENRA